MRKYGLGSTGSQKTKQGSQRKQMYRKNKLTECADCGTDENLCRHYLDGDTKNYNQENIVVVCKTCRSIRCDGWRTKPIECPVCGKIFTRKRRDRGKVCGVGCSGKYMKMVMMGEMEPDTSVPPRNK